MESQELDRILIVVPSSVGGTIQYSHNLANALAEAGHQVLLASAIGYELLPFPRRYDLVETFDRFRPRPRALWSFLCAVWRQKPDIVHFQGAQRPEFYLLIYALLCVLTGARFVWTPQDVLSNSHKRYHTALMRFLYARMRHIFLNARQNEEVVVTLFRYPPDQITVLPIPDLVAFARKDLPAVPPPEVTLEGKGPLFLCFGLIEERKGIGTLIRAFEAYRHAGGSGRLLIMGKPLADAAPYIRMLADSDVGDAARIIARYASFEEMNALFEAADAVVLPYHSGWNSGVLASAYGYGKPVIATCVGGFEEVVQDGVSGLLVAPEDPASLAEALETLEHDTKLRQKLSEGARAASEAASWDKVARTTIDVYDRTAKRTS